MCEVGTFFSAHVLTVTSQNIEIECKQSFFFFLSSGAHWCSAPHGVPVCLKRTSVTENLTLL